MDGNNLPKSYAFNTDYLRDYTPGMRLPKSEFVKGNKVIIPDKQHPLTRFLAYYFRLINGKNNLVWNAYREKSSGDLHEQGLISDEQVIAQSRGSIGILQAFREEVARTLEAAIQKGLAADKWPIDCLPRLVEELD